MAGRSETLRTIPLAKVLVIDTETTGTGPSDEILQLSAMWGTGTVAGSQYLKPVHTPSWPGAMAVNHITPEMVADKPRLPDIREKVESLLASARVIVGYNLDFDLGMLAHNGIHLPDASVVRRVDLMVPFAEVYGEWSDFHQNYRYQKLITCAKYYGYEGGGWHNALDDVRATLFCYKAMVQRGDL